MIMEFMGPLLVLWRGGGLQPPRPSCVRHCRRRKNETKGIKLQQLINLCQFISEDNFIVD